MFATLFVWQMLVQPAKMATEKNEEFDDFSTQKRQELKEVQLLLKEVTEAENTLQQISELYHDGYSLYTTFSEKEQWSEKMERWKERVEIVLTKEFSVAALHCFHKPGSGFEIITAWNWENNDDRWLKPRFSAKLYALDNLAQSASPLYLARMKTAGVQSMDETASIRTPAS